MRKILVLAITFFAAQFVLADIPGPRDPSPISFVDMIEGMSAEVIYETSRVAVGISAQLRTGSETYKVLRATDGMRQAVCFKRTQSLPRSAPSYKCSTEKSANGKKLPKFKPAIRMG